MSEVKKLKIILVNNYWYLRGGSERVVFATKKLLEEAGHEVEIFGMEHPDNIFSNKYFCSRVDFETARGFQKITVGLKVIYNNEAKRKFEELIRDFKPDVIHFHNIYHHLSFSLVGVAQKYHIPTLMTVHDYHLLSPNYNLFHHGEIDEKTLGRSYYRCFFTNSLENWKKSLIATVEMYVRKWKKLDGKIDYFISPSEFLKQKHVDAGFEVLKFFVIRNPLSFVKQLSNKEGDDVVFFGRLSVEKGIDALLDTAINTPQIPYIIIGDGPAKVYLEQRILNEKIKNVLLVGKKSGEELWRVVSEARLVVVPSVWYENAPMGILEAIQLGKIVLASDIGGIPELLPQEMLFQPANVDKLSDLVQTWYSCSNEERIKANLKLQKKMGNEYSPDIYIVHIVEVYNKVIL